MFNCGKMLHIFKTEKEDGDDALSYIAEWSCPEAKEAMLSLTSGDAKAYRKIDGSCGMIMRDSRESSRWLIYQRYDDKKGKFKDAVPEDYIPLVDGGNDKRRYYLHRIDRVQKGKNLQKMADGLYSVLDKYGDRLPEDCYSVELVGKNFNATPGVEGVGIALHQEQKVVGVLPRLELPQDWLDWFKIYFSAYNDEGLVIEHKGIYWKIHARKFVPHTRPYDPPVLLGTSSQRIAPFLVLWGFGNETEKISVRRELEVVYERKVSQIGDQLVADFSGEPHIPLQFIAECLKCYCPTLEYNLID